MSSTPVQGTSSSTNNLNKPPNLHGATSTPGLGAGAGQSTDEFSRSSSRTNLLTPGGAGIITGSKRNRSSSRLRKTSRPNLKRYTSIGSAHPPNLIYSVDDDINEDEIDANDSEIGRVHV